MGGLGSGKSWGRRKKTAEEAYSLRIGAFRPYLRPNVADASGAIVWKKDEEIVLSVDFIVLWSATPVIVLHYPSKDGTDMEMQIPLQATSPGLVGKRWWFTCSLCVRGVQCNRRVGRLFLPPGARYFGCRHCYDLSYLSAQMARHKKVH